MDKGIKVINTSMNTAERLTKKNDLSFTKDEGEESNVINIYDDVVYQRIEGFGGAFTQASSYTLDKMSLGKRKEVINAYFGSDGLRYTLCRTHINSCDFSTNNYSYDDVEGDNKLKNFSIDCDKRSLIPYIKEALSINPSLKLFASPWSPPAWMKTSETMNHGGKLKDECKKVWAKYIARYIKEYKKEGIAIWGVTVQNEPKAVQTWDSCVYTADDEREFVKNYLGPVFKKEELETVNIMVWDHNKERVYERAKTILDDADAAKYIWGVAFHWYSGDHFEALSMVHDKYPEKKLLFSEGCVGFTKKTDKWESGEKYAHDIIGDLNHYAVGWTDWNMVLDENGGPNHVGNYCDAPIIADTKSDALIYRPSYYYIGHLTKFIRPGARRIGFSKYTDKLEVTSFKNTDLSIAVVIMNRSDRDMPVNLRYNGNIARTQIGAHSITTLVFQQE